MDILNSQFKRKFSLTMYKNLKIKLAQMSFAKDFINDKRGDLYPLISKSHSCEEIVAHNNYTVKNGFSERFFCAFFPYATYELTAQINGGSVGFSFDLPTVSASIAVTSSELLYSCGDLEKRVALPECAKKKFTLIVSCRIGAFDVFFKNNGGAELFHTFNEDKFINSNSYDIFSNSHVSIIVNGNDCVEISDVTSYIDNGISTADMRPIRYENGEIMVEHGKVYITASIRMCKEMYQGVFSWIPGTAQFELTGALFYDSGDGKWCGDVAASVLYHRDERKWYLWVCSFAHDHVLGHAEFDGDIRFGVNAVDITLMNKADKNAKVSDFIGIEGDEDPDFFYDKETEKWYMAICRLDTETKKYRYVFFESDEPFANYRFLGQGQKGAETGGSFVKIGGEQYFICGNDFDLTSNYRIYHKNGMSNANFDYCDGGFRGWGTVMPIRLGSRTRYFWLTFDRHNGSDYNWSYGNIYCFEA